ncbi:unnamed protein product [Amoebophrya sp. A25]|nr:unnamed protein product [Amoebophrya sp. A25]|eukprot:GSA25T00024963001.1
MFGAENVGGNAFAAQFGTQNGGFGQGGGVGFLAPTQSQNQDAMGFGGGAAAAGGPGTNTNNAGGTNNANNRGAAGAGGGISYTPVTIYQIHKILKKMREAGGDAKPELYGEEVKNMCIAGQITKFEMPNVGEQQQACKLKIDDGTAQIWCRKFFDNSSPRDIALFRGPEFLQDVMPADLTEDETVKFHQNFLGRQIQLGSFVTLTGRLHLHQSGFWISVLQIAKVTHPSDIFLHSMRCIEHKKAIAKRVREHNAKILAAANGATNVAGGGGGGQANIGAFGRLHGNQMAAGGNQMSAAGGQVTAMSMMQNQAMQQQRQQQPNAPQTGFPPVKQEQGQQNVSPQGNGQIPGPPVVEEQQPMDMIAQALRELCAKKRRENPAIESISVADLMTESESALGGFESVEVQHLLHKIVERGDAYETGVNDGFWVTNF